MPWHIPDLMSQRLEFVLLARQPGVSFRVLCQRFGVSAKTGYKWVHRFGAGDHESLRDRSRRPKVSPARCSEQIAQEVVALYQQWGWGGRKLRRRLCDLGRSEVPAASTCTAILHRAGVFASRTHPPLRALQRFTRSQPNQLWQADFKGDFPTQCGQRCYPITALDDHSRYNVILEPAGDQTGRTVQQAMERAFRRYGLPEEILCDNGPPWGAGEPVCPYTSFTVWLLQIGVRVIHGRPYHPQTQGKEERFHRTLGRELLSRHTWRDLAHCGEHFASYRQRYNCERPHDELAGDTPVRHYQPSPRPMPPALPLPEYPSGTLIQQVRRYGMITFHSQTWYVGRAFAGLALGLRPSPQAEGKWQVWFSHHLLGEIDLTLPPEPKHKLRSIYST